MTEAELLDAIDANPDDDAPRLAHADWLEANGHKLRAEFIRAQLRGEAGNYRALVRAMPTADGMEWECRRGYPEVVRFHSLKAFKKGWPLTAGHRVRHVIFSGMRGQKLADEPGLASITSLEMTGTEWPTILAVLRSRHLGQLRHLSAGPSYPDDFSFLPVLAELPLLSGLRSLRYSFVSDGLPPGRIAALLSSPHLGPLRELYLEGWLGQEAMRELWESSSLSALTTLQLTRGVGWRPETDPGGLEHLGDGSATPSLESFLFQYHIGQGAGRSVADATRWTRLRQLYLHDTAVGDAGAEGLAMARHLSRLEHLSLICAKVSDAGATALANSPHLGRLSSLDLTANVIGRAGVVALGRSERLPSLRSLSLAHNPTAPALIEAVVARFRDGGPPIEDVAATPVPAPSPGPSAPLVGDAEEDGLMRAIWADTSDEVSRLVYADWLEERGEALHAAILRAQRGEYRHFRHQLEERMKKDAPCSFGVRVGDSGLVRVSIPVRSLRSKAFRRDGPAWLRQHHVGAVAPEGRPSDWAAVFAGDWLAHVRGLSFGGRWFDALDVLAASPHLAGLASLTLSPHDARDDQLAAFFRTAGLRGLCRLVQRDRYMPLEVLRAICDAPFAPNLRHLATARMNDEEVAHLGASPTLAGLVTLALDLAGDQGAKLLADATGLGSLRNLDLSGTWFGDVGLDALAGSALFSRLRFVRFAARRSFSKRSLKRFARAAPANCRVALAHYGTDDAHRAALAAIFGERLIVE
jgi:uncharacterized protein (TIGR02996 family)